MKKISLILALIFILTSIFSIGCFAAEESAVLSANFDSWLLGLPIGWSNSGSSKDYISKDTTTKVRGSNAVKITDTLSSATAGIKSSTG